ncbi:MAG: hypothetical protein ACPIOQ_31810 [Promethearchaeia archaeon]
MDACRWLATSPQRASRTTLPADAERVFGDFAPRERRPASPGQELARTAARAARLSVQLPGRRRPAPPASCVPHGCTALESRAMAAVRLSPQNS